MATVRYARSRQITAAFAAAAKYYGAGVDTWRSRRCEQGLRLVGLLVPQRYS
ncbi:hypothetical protein ACIQZB_32805 [Streptomyces sp. NPDC097727]|uniref:hypothetical protein n=1 Tax=Streptomyces sp. NPDC097727 TaxID=3366092 RepID=UPI00382DD654